MKFLFFIRKHHLGEQKLKILNSVTYAFGQDRFANPHVLGRVAIFVMLYLRKCLFNCTQRGWATKDLSSVLFQVTWWRYREPFRIHYTNHTTTSISSCSPTPNTRLYRVISSFGPMALRGLSDSFTVGWPLADTALQTSEKGASASFSVSPRKSLVNNVPQPKEVRTRPANRACRSMILSTSRPSEKISIFSRGSSPRSVHQRIAASAAASGAPESTRMPVHVASQSGAFSRKLVVPNVSGRMIRRLPSCSSCQSDSTS